MGTKTVLKKPFPRSYWVEEGRFLAGFYPGSTDIGQTETNMQALLSLGIRCFINLMEPKEKGYDGKLFKPYEPILKSISREDNLVVSYYNIPIRDLGAPSPDLMNKILQTIDEAIYDNKQPVYLHCRGGIGRTGTVVGCWLIEHKITSPEQVLDYIDSLREYDSANHIQSPESPEQIEFVQHWGK